MVDAHPAARGIMRRRQLNVMHRKFLLLSATLFCVIVGPFRVDGQHENERSLQLSWTNHGGELGNRRWAPLETKINTTSVTNLSRKWTFNTSFDVTATPSVDAEGGVVYISSWDGCQYALKRETGELIWKVNLTDIAPSIPGLVEGIYVLPFVKNTTTLFPALLSDVLCRSTPTIAGPLLVFGLFNPCYVLALDRSTGAVVWWTSLDKHRWCAFTQSATYYDGSIYIGTSSQEEGAPDAECCSFQAAFFRLDAKTGKTIWRVPMIPDNHNQRGLYSGVGIWGSSPPIDTERKLVYIATGNTYTVPPEVEACEIARLNQTHPPIPDPCLAPDNLAESIVAMDIDTGNISWTTKLGGYDTWTYLCDINPNPSPNCPKILGPDYDFAEAPFLLSTEAADLVVAGQKSGIVHALDRGTGKVVWQTEAGPGGFEGGAAWGMSTDGSTVFTNIINNFQRNFTLVPSSTVITWGGWVAINGTTGAVLWSTGDPNRQFTYAAVAYANGVVFGASSGNLTSGTPSGVLYALDSKTGKVLSSYSTEGAIHGGVSIVDGCVFQGLGITLITAEDYNSPPSIHAHSVLSLCAP